MYEVTLLSVVSILVITLIIMMGRMIKDHTTDRFVDALKQIAMGAIGGLFLGGFILFGLANGEEVGIVTIVFYRDDSCIVDFSSENDLFLERGDLMPGDAVSLNGEELILVNQGDGLWYEVWKDGEPVAAFLYPEDARWVQEAIER